MRVLIALLAVAAVGAVGWSLRLSRRLRHSERDRRRSADELNRRLSELFSLQELSFILSGSLQLDRIVEQVVRYAMRFLDAQGALVALTLDGEAAGGPGAGSEDRPLLRVTAADGTLAALAGRSIGADDPGLVVRSLGRERLELVRNSGGGPAPAGGGGDGRLAGGGPARRRVWVGGHPPALHRGHARGRRDRQCALLRDGAAREGAVGDRVRFAQRGDRGGGRRGTGAPGQPVSRLPARRPDSGRDRPGPGRVPGGHVPSPGGPAGGRARGRSGAADRAALGHAGGWGGGARDPGHPPPHPRTGGGARPERRGAGRGRNRPAGDGVPSDPERKTRRGGPARVRRGP